MWIETEDALAALYGIPMPAAVSKVTPRLTAACRRWIGQSRFCMLSTVGPEGTDCSPRGDDGPVVTILDDSTLALPDWRGNNRVDSLRNIVRDGRVSVTFLVAGSDIAMRVNGTARLTADATFCARFERKGSLPRTVIVIRIAEVYPQCSKAMIRSALWDGSAAPAGLPTLGDMLRDATGGVFDGTAFDAQWAEQARAGLW